MKIHKIHIKIPGGKRLLRTFVALAITAGAAGSLTALPTAGFIDREGNLVLTLPGLSDAGEFHQGLAPVKAGRGRWGYIDQRGKWLIPPQFLEARNFSEGLALVCPKEKGSYAFIDAKARGVLSVKADLVGDFHEGLAMLLTKGRCGYIDKTGKIVIPQDFLYDSSGEMKNSSQGVIPVCVASERKSDAKWTYIDQHLRQIFDKRFLEAREVSDGLAPVCVATGSGANERRWGFVDRRANFVIPPVYLDALAFEEGLARVRLADGQDKSSSPLYSYIDENNVLMPARFSAASSFSCGLAAAASIQGKSGARGYIDRTGHFVISERFCRADKFSEGFAFTKRPDFSRLWWDKY